MSATLRFVVCCFAFTVLVLLCLLRSPCSWCHKSLLLAEVQTVMFERSWVNCVDVATLLLLLYYVPCTVCSLKREAPLPKKKNELLSTRH